MDPQRIHRQTTATIIRHFFYRVVGPKSDDAGICAMANLLLNGVREAYNAQMKDRGGYVEPPMNAKEVIEAPDSPVLEVARMCHHIEAQCAGWEMWETHPARQFLWEIIVRILPNLPEWKKLTKEMDPQECEQRKKDGRYRLDEDGKPFPQDGDPPKRKRKQKPADEAREAEGKLPPEEQMTSDEQEKATEWAEEMARRLREGKPEKGRTPPIDEPVDWHDFVDDGTMPPKPDVTDDFKTYERKRIAIMEWWFKAKQEGRV